MEELDSMTVEQYTTPCPVSVKESDSLATVETLMEEYGIRHIPVVRDDFPIGIISERDLYRRARSEGYQSNTAFEVMTPVPFTVNENAPLSKVALEMSAQKVGSAIVVNAEGKLAGIFTSIDALNALVEVLRGDTEPL
jgi:acetoin utilization protein AcuB